LADIVASILVLTFFSPIILILAFLLTAVYKESPVSIQERTGLRGKPLRLYKLKSMRSHSEADGSEDTDEQRLTRIGPVLRRLKLDELPQFWNVIKGDMSLIGPRPLLMEYLPLYNRGSNEKARAKAGDHGMGTNPWRIWIGLDIAI
jgi:sugar transferase EpsL